MHLNQLTNNPGSKKNKKRLCRGIGSGKGKTGGRGVKGQKSRSGVAINGFEGGQMPLIKRLPKRGFNCPNSVKYTVINVSDIDLLFKSSKQNIHTITKDDLLKVGIIKSNNVLVKLLAGGGRISTKLSIKVDKFSKAAKQIIEDAGGQVL